MNKTWKQIGLWGVTPFFATCVALTLGMHRTAAAQTSVNKPDTGAVSEPFEASTDPGTKIQCNMALYGNGNGSSVADTAIDVMVMLAGPVGNESVRRTIHVPHTLKLDGTMKTVSIQQTGGNFDIYVDDVLAMSQALNQLPPGEPVIGTLFTVQTVVWGSGGPTPILMETTQVFGPDGKMQGWKHHELTGNVTLIK